MGTSLPQAVFYPPRQRGASVALSPLALWLLALWLGMPTRPHLRSVAEALWLANTRYGSFGSPLGLVLAQDGGELRFSRLTATSSEVTVPYPAWAARPDNALCLPTALALADEISTFAGFALWDDRHRPGVSISLSGQLVGHRQQLPRVEPGGAAHLLTQL